MLVSNIRCKICWKAWVRERFYSNFEKKGWEINDLSPLSWQFLRFYDLWVVFKGLGVFETSFVSRKLKYLNFDIMKCSSFSEFSSFAKDVILPKFDCVFVLAIRGLLHMIKNFVLWCDWCVLITITESFLSEKFPWRSHGVVENMCSFLKSYL